LCDTLSDEDFVSKIKSAKEKKALSLKKDRRNIFGENSKASRKGIRRGKQRSHMEERRSVGKILNRLREHGEEADAIDADVSIKDAIARSKLKAFEKMPDKPLGEVVKKKLEKRKDVQAGVPQWFPVFSNSDNDKVFDTPYIRAVHKGTLTFQFRYHVDVKWFGHSTKSTKKRRASDLREAIRWRKAILRDAPLLKGFFAEQPQWRERMLRWCEKVLAPSLDPPKA
jgi:hypothetical protein